MSVWMGWVKWVDEVDGSMDWKEGWMEGEGNRWMGSVGEGGGWVHCMSR